MKVDLKVGVKFSSSLRSAVSKTPAHRSSKRQIKAISVQGNKFQTREQGKYETKSVKEHGTEDLYQAIDLNETELSTNEQFKEFKRASALGNLVPLYERLFSDQLTPVIAYRCMVEEGDQELPSFLFESVTNGDQSGRYSFVASQPALEVMATGKTVTILDHATQQRTVKEEEEDPLETVVAISRKWKPVRTEGMPRVFTGGWAGYCGYDTVRYVYGGKLPFGEAAADDRGLPDMHMALYNEVVVFDQATKLAFICCWLHLGDHASPEHAFQAGKQRLAALAARLSTAPSLTNAKASMSLAARPSPPTNSNMSPEEFLQKVGRVKEHILAGDVFQLVLSQRFQRRTRATPFEIYRGWAGEKTEKERCRALRVVNPSPYMIYLQARGSTLVASSPEILCKVDEDGTVTNRPLAGTRRRGKTRLEDKELEVGLLADEKERAEHIMLVDLGRNDVGKVAEAGSVEVTKLMEVERYSHVMHISSTVVGSLLPQLDAWDALRAALPAGTISGAPKVKAMQILDVLEPTRRGPYGGGIGHVSFTGGMDMALALRTMVVPTGGSYDYLFDYSFPKARREWAVHIQAGAGLVADSDPQSEFEETVNKAAALGRAIDLAEQAFVEDSL